MGKPIKSTGSGLTKIGQGLRKERQPLHEQGKSITEDKMSEKELERIFQEEEDVEKVWEAVEIFLNTKQEEQR